MEDLFIKTKAITDGATLSSKGRDNPTALAGLAISFQALLHKAGLRIEAGLNAIADRAGISAIVDRFKPPHPADDYRDRRSYGERDRLGEPARADDHADSRSDDHRVGRDDGYGRDRGVERRDSHGDGGGADRGADHADDYAGRQDGSVNENRGGDENSATNDDAGAGDDSASTTESGDEAQTAEGQSDGQNETVSAGTDAVTAQVGVSADPTGQILAGLAAGGTAHTAEGQASVQGKLSAAESLAAAEENISKATPVASGKTDGSQGTHQAQANASDQAKTVANARSQVADETETGPVDTTLQSQAAGIAKAFGEGNRPNINVNVTQEAPHLVSKPGATLTANAVINSEASSQSQTSHQGGANTHGGQNAAATAQQAQAGLTQAAQNTQALAQASTDAKGLVQASAASGNAGGSAHSGGGEGAATANTGGVSASQQAQQAGSQTAANQANEAQKQNRFGRSMVDQVFVKITKAIQAGTDKITIQLRPANMGRVEVKMELTQDNRLTALITVDTKETLDNLQKDAKELQRALQEAGLQMDSGDLSFNLRGQEGQGEDGDGSSGRGGSLGDEGVADLDKIMEEAARANEVHIITHDRIDVRV